MSAQAPRDPLLGYVFLITTGAQRGEVVRVIDVGLVHDEPTCFCESTVGPLTFPRHDVAVHYHRERDVFYPWSATYVGTGTESGP